MLNDLRTFARLNDGTWGLRGKNMQPGDRVRVTKRSGHVKYEIVGRIVWRGDDGMTLATIQDSPSRRHVEHVVSSMDAIEQRLAEAAEMDRYAPQTHGPATIEDSLY